MYKIYKIVNIINGNCYVGMTKQSLNKRFNQHKDNAFNKNKKTVLYDAMRSYGCEKFVIELITTTDSFEECCKTEVKMISEIGHYNIAKGGNGGFVVKDIETWKEKLSVSRIGRTPAKDMKHSEKNKNLFSEVSRKYWATQETYSWEDIKNLTHKEAKENFGISTTHYYRLKKRFGINDTK